MTTLVIQCDGSAPTRLELPPGEYSLGADDANAIVIDHPTVSRHHCDLFVQSDGQVIVLDAGSTNGTWLAEERINKAVVAPGQSLQAGAAHITVDKSPIPPLPPRRSVPIPVPLSLPTVAATLTPSSPSVPAPPQSFIGELPDAFGYPFRGEAYVCIIIVVVLGLLQYLIPGFLGFLGAVIGLVIGCYLILLWQQIIQTTIAGQDQFPDLPQVSLDWKENLSLYLRYVALTWVCFGLVFVYYYAKMWDPTIPAWLAAFGYGFGCLYFPMALLAFIMTDSLAVLSPIFIIRSICRKFPDYLLLVGLFAAALGAAHLLAPLVNPAMESGQAQTISRLRRAVVSAVGGAVYLYFCFVWMRLLGLFYRHHRDRLAWTY